MGKVSSRPGMGAVPYKDKDEHGVTFRVWAGSAKSVNVAGTFNGWSVTEHPLSPHGNGYWSADIPGLKPDQKHRYRYVMQSPFVEGEHWRTDPYCKSVANNQNSDGEIISFDYNWEGDHFRAPAWNDLVIYELHVSSFNRDSKPGSFDSIIEKLNYLRDLGVNAIEVLPIFGFPGDFSLGYNPAFPFDIESSYGTVSDFKDFVKAAHKKGIAIILDIVLNHFGPFDLDDSLWRFDGWYEDDKSGIYFYNDWRYKTGFGDRPDFSRGEVRQFLRDNAMMWLEEYRVDGLRFDSTVNIRNAYGSNGEYGSLPEGWSFLQWINDEVDSKLPWKIMIAEDLQGNNWITKATGEGGAGFDSQWDSTFFWTLNSAITASSDEQVNMEEVQNALIHSSGCDFTMRTVYINNHDECAEINHKFRLADRIWMGHADSWVVRKKYILAAGIVFTTPGIPFIFQGDEFLEWGSWHPESTLDWSKKDRFKGILDAFSRLIHLRRNWEDNTRGLRGQHINAFHCNNKDKLIAYHRWEYGGAGDDVVVVANFANRSYDSYSIGFPRAGKWYVRFNSDWVGYGADFGNDAGYDTEAVADGMDGMPCSGNVGIGAYSGLILSQ